MCGCACQPWPDKAVFVWSFCSDSDGMVAIDSCRIDGREYQPDYTAPWYMMNGAAAPHPWPHHH